MTRISDPLELLTAQHADLDALLDRLTAVELPARDAVFAELADKVVLHLAAEQELLLPAVAGQVSPDVQRELAAEQQEIKRILADLLWFGLDDAAVAAGIPSLRALLHGHAAWQETELFTTMAETMSGPALVELGERLCAWSDNVPSMALAA